MKLFITLSLLTLTFCNSFSQMSDSTEVSYPDTVVHILVFDKKECEQTKPLDVRWSGFFLGLRSENKFSDNHTLKFEIKPSLSANIDIARYYSSGLEVVIPTEKGDYVYFLLHVRRKVF